MKFPLIGQAYTSRSSALSAQECINLYYEPAESGGRSDATLHGTPGLKSFASAGNGPIRGMHVMSGVLYVVSGAQLFSLSTVGTVKQLGSIAGSGMVSMESSYSGTSIVVPGPQQLCITSKASGYIYDTANGLVKIVDPDFQESDTVSFMDGYFIFNWRGTHKFFSSILYDGTSYLALDVGEKLTYSDNIVGLIADHKEIWLFGEKTIEIWYNQAPDAGFPFTQIESAYIERGCAAALSIAKIDNTIFWLGEDLMVYRADGYNAVRISTHAIEFAIKKYADIDKTSAFIYSDEGHKFYVLTFPAGGTWVYDVATGAWHERRSAGLQRWRINAYAYFNDKHYVGDYMNNNVYEMDLNTYTENGTEIQRIRSTTYVHAEAEPVFLDWLQIVIESGAGLTTGQGSDPRAMLQYSDDGGKTWSNEKWRAMGKVGEYFRRVRWTQLGRFYQRVFRVMISDPIKVVLTEADIDLTKGSR